MNGLIDQIHQKLQYEIRSSEDVGIKKPLHAVSTVLLSVAYSDLDFGRDEIKEVLQLLEKEFEPDEGDRSFIHSLSVETITDPVKLDTCTETIKENYSVEERMRILSMVWKIIVVDGVLAESERELAFSLENKLNLTFDQGVEARKLVIQEKV